MEKEGELHTWQSFPSTHKLFHEQFRTRTPWSSWDFWTILDLPGEVPGGPAELGYPDLQRAHS